jgi:hypothetical protein
MPDPSTMFGVNLASIRDRLRALDYFTGVEDIQSGAEAISGLAAFIPPAAFVSIASESYEPNKVIGGHRQRATVSVSVLFCIAGERIAGDTSDEVEQARKVILAQLAGWQPEGAETSPRGVALQCAAYRRGPHMGRMAVSDAFPPLERLVARTFQHCRA